MHEHFYTSTETDYKSSIQLDRWSFIRLSLLVGGRGKRGAEARDNRRRGIREAWEEREGGGNSKNAGNERNRGNYATMLSLTFCNLKELTGGGQEKEAGVGDARYGRREVCPLSSSHNIQ